jgi:hypothetical protein
MHRDMASKRLLHVSLPDALPEQQGANRQSHPQQVAPVHVPKLLCCGEALQVPALLKGQRAQLCLQTLRRAV